MTTRPVGTGPPEFGSCALIDCGKADVCFPAAFKCHAYADLVRQVIEFALTVPQDCQRNEHHNQESNG